MARGLSEVVGGAALYPDYHFSLEAAMWHCLRLMDVRGPTLAEFEDPYLESGSRLYDATSVGLATCDDSRFRAGFTTPHNRRTHQSQSQLGEESDRESTWSGRSTGLPQGFRLISEFKLQEMEEPSSTSPSS